ncbi:MAG: DUF6314 family protein [Maritimibacter sp.]
MRELADFEGRWRMTRQIDDALANQLGQFVGEAVFVAQPGGLHYTERGTLTLNGTGFAASRSYMWREVEAGVEVDFEDGRFFHGFALAQPRQKAHHSCSPDEYSVTYDFAAWPRWRAIWAVKGPRKDYVSNTQYERIAE